MKKKKPAGKGGHWELSWRAKAILSGILAGTMSGFIVGMLLWACFF